MKEENIQIFFKFLLYVIIIPYLFYISYINENKIVLLCTSCILITHIYKDIINPYWNYPNLIKILGTYCAYMIFRYGDNNIILGENSLYIPSIFNSDEKEKFSFFKFK